MHEKATISPLLLMLLGLRVRMGIATGTLEEGRDPAASAVNDLAKREWQPFTDVMPIVGLFISAFIQYLSVALDVTLAVVSDVAWGGQILLCSTSFEAIMHQTEDLDVASKGEVHGRPSQGWWRWWKW